MATPPLTIPPSSEVPPAKLAKKNEKIKEIFEKHKLFPNPVRVQCWKVVPDMVNRSGQPPNMRYLHENLEPNQEVDGFDELRPKPGVLKKLSEPVQKKRQIDYNKELMAGTTGLYPALYEELIEYSCLGANHLTLSHRGIHSKLVSSITGKAWSTNGCKNLDRVLQIGLEYYIFDDKISDDDAKLVSEAHNAEQDQNAVTGDGQNIRKVLNIFQGLQKIQKHVPVGRVIADYAACTLVKVNTNNVAAWVKFVSSQGAGRLVEEFLDFISRCVNEQEVRCPPSWLDELARAIPEEFGITKNCLCYIQYSGDGRIVQQRPMPDTLRFVSAAEMTALGANKPLLTMVEDFHLWNRIHIETEFKAIIGTAMARQNLVQLEENVTRLAISKGLRKGTFATKASGKLDGEKLVQLRKDWFASLLKQSNMQSLLPLPTRLGIDLGDSKAVHKEEEFLEAANFDAFKYVPSLTKDLLAKGFHIGAKVKPVRRTTVWFSKKLRRDINVCDRGWIQGEAEGLPIVKIQKQIDGKDYEVDVRFMVDNMELADDDCAPSASSGTGGGVTLDLIGVPTIPKKFDYLKDDTNPGAIVVKDKWYKNQAKSSEETIVKNLHSMVNWSLSMTLKMLPDFGEAHL